MSRVEVTDYRVFLYDREEDPDVGRIIHLYGEDGIVAVCLFYLTRDVPISRKQDSLLHVTFPEAAYAGILNLLRKETPIFVSHNERTGSIGLSLGGEDADNGERF